MIAALHETCVIAALHSPAELEFFPADNRLVLSIRKEFSSASMGEVMRVSKGLILLTEQCMIGRNDLLDLNLSDVYVMECR